MPIVDNKKITHILINRIDAMGDVVLQLPACIYLKQLFPDVIISFLGRSYTKPVIDACKAVDHFINYDELKDLSINQIADIFKEKAIDAIVHEFPQREIAEAAKKAGIKIRIGVTSRNYHFFTCNKLVRLSRRRSNLHEAQQDVYLCKPLGVTHVPTLGTLSNLFKGNFKPTTELPAQIKDQLKDDKFNLIIHAKSNGNGKEWDLDNFTDLIKLLPHDNFRVFITGSQKEHELFKTWMPQLPASVIDLSGKLTLDELIAFIYHADGLLASGTGPLHVAAASGIHTLGLFPITIGIHATRWAPLGIKAEHIESNSDDLSSITVDMVLERINAWLS
ncbi:glycosyltransferase family 9 protein [Mucilaginibacter sp. HC2]|uniref:glycosyltransferase family 9 protein n=1 Tax=Mucilaginibacter inviolabilis TaxID=2714892 RepID=UPI0014099D3F|nr:glycosyltransferase family 9 protein [Mucilaginibacter inviolabilis]NHA05905.1 glycosyltransferase family 9 protein [Mucilaginibacter inviolabilis]